MKDFVTWLMLQTQRDGNTMSVKDAVVEQMLQHFSIKFGLKKINSYWYSKKMYVFQIVSMTRYLSIDDENDEVQLGLLELFES